MVMKSVSIGRGGYPNRRASDLNAEWAVDVKVSGGGPDYYPIGVITECFRNKSDAIACAARVNAGTRYQSGQPFHDRAHDAIVVPAWYVDDDESGQRASPWTSTDGMQTMADAYREAGVAMPDWLQVLMDRQTDTTDTTNVRPSVDLAH